MDTALPFGLRSSPKVLTAMADGLLWILGAKGIRSAMHYLNDYLFFGDRGSKECEEALRLALRLCELLGIPVASHKLEGPAAVLTFLGILLDTVRFEIRLPEDKLVRLRALLSEWQGKKACTKRQLLSLIHLSTRSTPSHRMPPEAGGVVQSARTGGGSRFGGQTAGRHSTSQSRSFCQLSWHVRCGENPGGV